MCLINLSTKNMNILAPNLSFNTLQTTSILGCPIFSKSCQIILPKKYIVRNVIIKPCTDFQLFSQPSWSPAMRHKVRPDPFISRKKNSSKVPFVGTLNLCLETPDTMQKTRHKSELPGLRKRPKTVENWVKSNFLFFLQFLDVFSSYDDRINFSSFALCQASQDTSLEYPQRVLWRIFFSDL